MPWTTWQAHEHSAHDYFKTKPTIKELEKRLAVQFGRSNDQIGEVCGFSDCILAG